MTSDQKIPTGSPYCKNCEYGKFKRADGRGVCQYPDVDRREPFIIKQTSTCESFSRSDASVEQIDIMARQYVDQAWKHTRRKIVLEMRSAGISAEEIVEAIIRAEKRAKGLADD